MSERKEILATQDGTLIAITQMPDEVFAQKILGDGLAVIPTSNIVKSPVSGTIVDITDTNHAVAISTDDGLDVLVHVGVDTVSLKGEGFKPLVAVDDIVKAGDPILEADIAFIESKGFKLHTPTVITNSDELSLLTITEPGPVTAGKTVVAYYEK